jgi:hypothetical protein
MKYILVLVVVGVLVWMLVARQRSRSKGAHRDGAGPNSKPPTAMLACAHCGLLLPPKKRRTTPQAGRSAARRIRWRGRASAASAWTAWKPRGPTAAKAIAAGSERRSQAPPADESLFSPGWLVSGYGPGEHREAGHTQAGPGPDSAWVRVYRTYTAARAAIGVAW